MIRVQGTKATRGLTLGRAPRGRWQRNGLAPPAAVAAVPDGQAKTNAMITPCARSGVSVAASDGFAVQCSPLLRRRLWPPRRETPLGFRSFITSSVRVGPTSTMAEQQQQHRSRFCVGSSTDWTPPNRYLARAHRWRLFRFKTEESLMDFQGGTGGEYSRAWKGAEVERKSGPV